MATRPLRRVILFSRGNPTWLDAHVQRSYTTGIENVSEHNRTTGEPRKVGTRNQPEAGWIRLDDRQVIHTHSLSDTLQAHREANAESIPIQRVRTAGEGPVRTERHYKTKHLDLNRDAFSVEVTRTREDYKGHAQGLAFDWVIVGDVHRYLRLPWMKELDAAGPSRLRAGDRLTDEIRAADAFFTPTAREDAAVAAIIEELETWMQKCHRNFLRFDVIGSRATGLASPLSDIDVNLMMNGQDGETFKTVNSRIMHQLSRGMGRRSLKDTPFMTTFFASRATVPIIAGIHGPSGLEFQIQSASSGYRSLQVTQQIASDYLSVKPLFRILKQMLKMRGLTRGSKGGLTSYPLFIMIAVCLKRNALDSDPHNLGHNLIKFLEFWSNMDFYKTGVTHVPGAHLTGSLADDERLLKYFENEEITNNTISAVAQDPTDAQPVLFDVRKKLGHLHKSRSGDFMMVLHDPADLRNDLGRSASTIKHIQATLMEIHASLKKDMAEWNDTIRRTGLSAKEPPSLLRSLIEGDYSMYNLERKRVRP
ncbi:hypothetical protein LTS08_008245 [Lithohypha guttulata]|uniref:Poly(A) RNA polymerase mitochondrial-like central palm domain-containing protein n=1 Tax=Lithohypha guttulata TaxID=1690604 RepID=A0AAN7T310_9EURO|nr:hypothetical protein LTR05_004007 [Lithohypha guttulata]KAK5095086.1 hypothetical protein LTS08_008245 [Lithohypha guttulata]